MAQTSFSKRILFLVFLFLIDFASSRAQLILNPRFFGGYVVNQANDTIRGVIKLPKSAAKGDFSYTDILWKIRFIDKDGNERKYLPSELKEFTFWLENGKEVKFLAYDNSVKAFGGFGADNKHLFLELAVNGHLKLLRGYFFTSTPNGRKPNIVNYLQKGSGKLFRYRYVLFRMDMAEYLKDNMPLAQKIRQRDYRPRDIQTIVNEYNIWYVQKK
jgi:hypothetical protein